MRCVADAATLYESLPWSNGCTHVPWQEAVAAAVPRASPVTLVNVGANKGYKVPEFLALWSQSPVGGHMLGWQRHLLAYADRQRSGSLKGFSCGNCKECRAAPPPKHGRTGARVHLLELAPVNQALLPEMRPVHSHVAPRTDRERAVQKLWCAVLGTREEDTSMDADFFFSGGSSLLAGTLAGEVKSVKPSGDTEVQYGNTKKIVSAESVATNIRKPVGASSRSASPEKPSEAAYKVGDKVEIFILGKPHAATVLDKPPFDASGERLRA